MTDVQEFLKSSKRKTCKYQKRCQIFCLKVSIESDSDSDSKPTVKVSHISVMQASTGVGGSGTGADCQTVGKTSKRAGTRSHASRSKCEKGGMGGEGGKETVLLNRNECQIKIIQLSTNSNKKYLSQLCIN
jgi:hypothetical protein